MTRRLKQEGSDISAILRIVSDFPGKTIQQLTSRVSWTLMAPQDVRPAAHAQRIPFDDFIAQNEGRCEIQMVLPTTKKVDVPKKKLRHRHYSTVEGMDVPHQRTRRRSMSKDFASHPAHAQRFSPSLSASEYSPASDVSTPCGPAFSPTVPDPSTQSTGCASPDLNQALVLLTMNEHLLDSLAKTFLYNHDVYGQFIVNTHTLMLLTHQIGFPAQLPFFQMRLVLPQELLALYSDIVQSPSYLHLSL